MSGAIMVPGHPSWGLFLDRLSRARRCNRTTEHARAVLERMPGIDVDASLEALRGRGGVCDCAILFDLPELERIARI